MTTDNGIQLENNWKIIGSLTLHEFHHSSDSEVCMAPTSLHALPTMSGQSVTDVLGDLLLDLDQGISEHQDSWQWCWGHKYTMCAQLNLSQGNMTSRHQCLHYLGTAHMLCTSTKSKSSSRHYMCCWTHMPHSKTLTVWSVSCWETHIWPCWCNLCNLLGLQVLPHAMSSNTIKTKNTNSFVHPKCTDWYH